MLGEETYRREAVLWEIKQSYKMGKEVIGLRIYKDEAHRIPQPMRENNARILNWNLGDLSEVLSEAYN